MTNVRGGRDGPIKRETKITIMCPVCSGAHDYPDCNNLEGNRTFERLFRPRMTGADRAQYS